MRYELLATVSQGNCSTGACPRPTAQGQILTRILGMWKIPYKMLIDDTRKLVCITRLCACFPTDGGLLVLVIQLAQKNVSAHLPCTTRIRWHLPLALCKLLRRLAAETRVGYYPDMPLYTNSTSALRAIKTSGQPLHRQRIEVRPRTGKSSWLTKMTTTAETCTARHAVQP